MLPRQDYFSNQGRLEDAQRIIQLLTNAAYIEEKTSAREGAAAATSAAQNKDKVMQLMEPDDSEDHTDRMNKMIREDDL